MQEAERQELIDRFSSDLVEKEAHLKELRERYETLGSYREPDPTDDADRVREQTETGAQIYCLTKNEIPRLRGVIGDLKGGWNGECTEGCGTSVLNRLKKGHATHHCCACKTELEEQASRRREGAVSGVYRTKLAYA